MTRQQFDSQSLATFRMRCWHELADMEHPHYIQDYMQLSDDACRMHIAIGRKLRRDFPVHQPLDESRANTEAELLVTALLAGHYTPAYFHQSSDIRERAYTLLQHIHNKRLLCYLLVLLLFTDSQPSQNLQHQIDALLPTLEQQNPEDRHIQNLYHATLEV